MSLDMSMVAGMIEALGDPADPEVIEQAVSNWLNDHPEAVAPIDDTAGAGDTDKLWSADKTAGEVATLSEAITPLETDVYGNYGVATVTEVQGMDHRNSTTAYETRTGYNTFYFPCVEGITYRISLTRMEGQTTTSNVRLCVGSDIPANGITAEYKQTIAVNEQTKNIEYLAPSDGYIGLSVYSYGGEGIASVSCEYGKVGLYDAVENRNINSADLWMEGYYGATTGEYQYYPSSSPFRCMVNGVDKIVKTIKCPNSLKFRIHAWQANGTYVGTWNGNAFVNVGGSSVTYFTSVVMSNLWAVNSTYVLKLVLVNAASATTAVTVDDTLSVEMAANAFTFDEKRISAIENQMKLGNNFVIDSNFLKRAVEVTEIGSISGAQAFCEYNGKYYSCYNTSLYRQSGSFSQEASATVAIGHGNALQLGSNGVAYASGWDDDKVYVVDLATMAVTESISLPVSGYTTCAVDDVNEIMYIFGRTDGTSTVDNWTFTVWDYGNDNVLLTKKITNPFAAIQGVDFYNGRILVGWGLGTSQAPTGLAVYDTNGNMLCEYKVESFGANEIEGVCFDRTNNRLMFSFINQKVFKIEAKV